MHTALLPNCNCNNSKRHIPRRPTVMIIRSSLPSSSSSGRYRLKHLLSLNYHTPSPQALLYIDLNDDALIFPLPFEPMCFSARLFTFYFSRIVMKLSKNKQSLNRSRCVKRSLGCDYGRFRRSTTDRQHEIGSLVFFEMEKKKWDPPLVIHYLYYIRRKSARDPLL